jgi:hypothetical protein
MSLALRVSLFWFVAGTRRTLSRILGTRHRDDGRDVFVGQHRFDFDRIAEADRAIRAHGVVPTEIHHVRTFVDAVHEVRLRRVGVDSLGIQRTRVFLAELL